MSKKKKKPTPIQHRPQPRALTPKLERQLDQINDLLKQGDAAEALRQLETLHNANPRQPDILSELIRIAALAEDKQTYLRYALRLSQLLPSDGDSCAITR